MTEYMGGENSLIVHLEVMPRKVWHPWPFNCLKPLTTDRYIYIYICGFSYYYWNIKRAVFQFVFLKPVTAFLTLLLAQVGWLGEGSYSYKTGFLYITIMYNISLTVIIYIYI